MCSGFEIQLRELRREGESKQMSVSPYGLIKTEALCRPDIICLDQTVFLLQALQPLFDLLLLSIQEQNTNTTEKPPQRSPGQYLIKLLFAGS